MADNLFNSIYNPDVLECIANLSNDEVFTPPAVANAMLDMLPQELFRSPDTKFLDPATKSGVFLREIAKRLLVGLEDQIPDLQERVDHIFQKQLYGIAITELTSHLARRSVYCSKYASGKYSVSHFETVDGNIRFKNTPHHFVGGKCVFCGASESEYGGKRREGMETHAYEFIHTTKPEEILRMKFDVVIGNPPYQLSTAGDENGPLAKPIYQLFVEHAIKLNARHVIMITPSRWFAGGWGLDRFRDMMITCNHIQEIHDYQVSSDCFSGVQIKGGVSYFLYSRDYNGPCKFISHSSDGIDSENIRYLKEPNCDVLIRQNQLVSIYEKVQRTAPYKTFDTIVSGRSPFGYETNTHGHEKKNADDLRYYERKGFTYVTRASLKKGHSWVEKYKVYISKAYGAGEGFPHQIINKPVWGDKGTVCSGTFLMVGPFDTEMESINAMNYMCTKFFRALVSLNKISQDSYAKVYSCVPILDFNEEWNDEKLYKKYRLNDDEIDFIDSIIRPMDLNGGDDDA